MIFPAMKDNRVVTIIMVIIAAFIIYRGLQELTVVLIPFSLAVLLSFIFQPIVLYLKIRRVPTWLALVLVIVVSSVLLGLMGWIVYSSAQQMVGDFNLFSERFETQIRPVIDKAEAFLANLTERLDLPTERGLMERLLDTILQIGPGPILADIASIALNAAVVLLFMMFILAGAGQLESKIGRTYPHEVAQRIVSAMNNISKGVRQYLIAKTIVSASTGVLVFIVLRSIGVEFPVFWAFLTFVLNFIPNFGSFVAVTLPSVWAFLQFPGLGPPILATLLMWLVQGIMGNVVEPKLMAFSLDLSPLLVLISLLFWGSLWGVVGIILAVPLTATIKIICENVDGLESISVLMGSLKRDRQNSGKGIPKTSTST